MKPFEIYINNKSADLNESLSVVLDKVVSEFRNPIKKTGEYSYTIKLPLTQKNKALFGYQSERSFIGKFRQTYECRVEDCGVEVLSGVFHLTKITSSGFEGFITGTKGYRLTDLLDAKKKLTDIESFSPIGFQGDLTVWESLDADLTADTSEIAFPYIVDSFARLQNFPGAVANVSPVVPLGYEDFGVSHFAASVFKNIFADAGYTLTGSVLARDDFKRLLMPYSGSNSEYNYGTLTPCNGKLGFNYYHTHTPLVFEGDDYKLYVMQPEYALRDVTGDLCFSLGKDGVYTCKNTGTYTFELEAFGYAYDNGVGQPDVETKQVLLFREITNNEVVTDEVMNITSTYASFGFSSVADYDTLNESVDNFTVTTGWRQYHTSNFTAKLVEGRQYQMQVYIAIHNTIDQSDLVFRLRNGGGGDTRFKITAMDGKQQLDPAKFLPEMTQMDFINAIFKLYNLYYSIDPDTSVITLYTRDEWFALNATNITDISEKASFSQFEETPLSDEEKAASKIRWKADEADYILSKTGYLEAVNGEADENAFEMPFSPLAFMYAKIQKVNPLTGAEVETSYDLIPAAIPNSDITDATLLEDIESVSNFGYGPKLCLYYGNVMTDSLFQVEQSLMTGEVTKRLYGISFGRSSSIFLPGGKFPGGVDFGDLLASNYKPMPKLGFFNVMEQLAYSVSVDASNREFTLVETTSPTMYSEGNADFLETPTASIALMDANSLDLLSAKSIYQTLYRNDLLITDWSNYAEGQIKMDPVLYQNLNGRNIIRLDGDLYLLAEVKGFRVGGNSARIKIYKLISS